MPMLELDGAPFSVGRAVFHDDLPTSWQSSSARVYVKIAVDGIGQPLLALLDTGADYSVLEREIAEEAGLTEAEGRAITIKHREGTTPGRLVRANVTVLADEGVGLNVDATVFIPDDGWPAGRNFIGYSGFLERIRIALDPQSNDIYFGGY